MNYVSHPELQETRRSGLRCSVFYRHLVRRAAFVATLGCLSCYGCTGDGIRVIVAGKRCFFAWKSIAFLRRALSEGSDASRGQPFAKVIRCCVVRQRCLGVR